jgi:hypothetical protein
VACYPQPDDRFAVWAAIGGSPARPGWYFNLKAHPRITQSDSEIADFEYCEDPRGGCCRRVDPFEYRLRALILICRLEVSDHRKTTAPSEQ